ncbi:Mitochondrial editing factor 20 [Heracleum sosnowskyi]|uniref:Mitochondrial editing factor 20 n=1 Tax=Heracleum sosnowskyi TaxID=360622 RepID=A0AAD8MAZ9_9APIA|nr:Mitochondrial editing factor 20 [Heracleum sosnowskyi]
MHPLPRATCLSLLNLKLKNINKVKQLHAQLITNALNSPSNLGKLIQQYCAFSSPQATKYAHLILTHFDADPNVYLLNVLIRCSSPRNSVQVFRNHVSRPGVCFDKFSYVFALGACARACLLWEGKQIHCRVMKHGFCSHVMVQTTAVHFYGKSGEIGCARKVFDEMSMRSRETWNAMISGYCSQRERVGGDACWIALGLFSDMLGGGVKPDGTTTVCVLSAVSQLGVLESGVCVHGYIEKMLCEPENDVYVGTGLVDMYSKCGCVDSAMWIFERMKERNVLTWTAMTSGLAIHGRGKEALEVLARMEGHGILPNAVTFTSLLSACCHAGLVEEGLSLFYSMDRFGVVPKRQHYGCIVDLLGRAGHLEEAYKFIDSMQVERDAILWRTLLSACNVHGDLLTGEKVKQVLLHLQTEQIIVSSGVVADMSEDYIALSNMYALADRWEDVKIVREEMKFKGYETKPGLSSLQ